MKSGIYITWVSSTSKEDQCFRIGSESRCFCGHFLSSHDKDLTKSKVKSGCQTCKCKEFKFIPRRPEELGQWWMPRRKGFDINTWRAACVCKHGHDEHAVGRPFKCLSCSCYDFQGDFCCLACDQKFEEHETLWETEKERQQNKKGIREDYLPLANNPDI